MTDIVDSTRMLAKLGDAGTADLWAAHDRMARALLLETRGTELERTDGFLLRFDTVDDAADFAESYHETLAEMPIPLVARVGIHQGSLEVRQSADGARNHAGIAIPVTARIMSIAIGRQTLLSAPAVRALERTDRQIRSWGHWRLKGVELPFEIFETGTDASPWSSPPDGEKVYRVTEHDGFWIPVRDLRFNLPGERNVFVGRRAALRSLADRVAAGARLVSVLGTGGTGKTRLVQRYAWTWLGDFDGGVWFCDLAAATSESGLLHAVAKGLDVPLGQHDSIEQLGEAIAGRGPCLVVLDNFEQLCDLAESTIGIWLARAPQARFVVTTRTLLGIDGEDIFVLDAMDDREAEELFIERGMAAKHDFAVPEAERRALLDLMHLLEGLPLAVELAAARVRIMNVPQMVVRMKERFSVLAAERGRTKRHSTLKATLDWSWDLLPHDDRIALAVCAVFEGGFSLDAFESIFADATGRPEAEGTDRLQALVDKSWLRDGGSSRFYLLPSVQEYTVLQQNRGDGEAGMASRQHAAAIASHWRYYAARTEMQATADRCVDLDNLFAATRRSIADGDLATAVSALLNTWAALRLCGPYGAIEPLLSGLTSLEGLNARQAARAYYVAGAVAKHRGAHADAAQEFGRGLQIAEEDDTEAIAQIGCAHGELMTVQFRYAEAESLLDRALHAAQASGRADLTQAALNALGGLRQAQSRYDEALECYERALQSAVGLSDRRWEGGILGNLGTVHYTTGRLDEARDHYVRALAIANAIGDRRWAGNTRCNLGLLLQDLELFDQSRDELRAALTDARELGHRHLELTVLWNLGLLAVATHDHLAAKRHFKDARVVADRLADQHGASALDKLIEESKRAAANTRT